MDEPFTETVMFTTVLTVTVVVVIGKVVEVAPAGTVTVDGGTPWALFEVMLITYPPVGAGPLIVTVPVVDLPPCTD